MNFPALSAHSFIKNISFTLNEVISRVDKKITLIISGIALAIFATISLIYYLSRKQNHEYTITKDQRDISLEAEELDLTGQNPIDDLKKIEEVELLSSEEMNVQEALKAIDDQLKQFKSQGILTTHPNWKQEGLDIVAFKSKLLAPYLKIILETPSPSEEHDNAIIKLATDFCQSKSSMEGIDRSDEAAKLLQCSFYDKETKQTVMNIVGKAVCQGGFIPQPQAGVKTNHPHPGPSGRGKGKIHGKITSGITQHPAVKQPQKNYTIDEIVRGLAKNQFFETAIELNIKLNDSTQSEKALEFGRLAKKGQFENTFENAIDYLIQNFRTDDPSLSLAKEHLGNILEASKSHGVDPITGIIQYQWIHLAESLTEHHFYDQAYQIIEKYYSQNDKGTILNLISGAKIQGMSYMTYAEYSDAGHVSFKMHGIV